MATRGSSLYIANGAKRSAVEFAKRLRSALASRTRRKGLSRRVTITGQPLSYHAYLSYKVKPSRENNNGYDVPISVAMSLQTLSVEVDKLLGFKWPPRFQVYLTARIRYEGYMILSAGTRASGGGTSPKHGRKATYDDSKRPSKVTRYTIRMHFTRVPTSFAFGVENFLSHHSSVDGTQLTSFRIHFLSDYPKPKKPKGKKSGKGASKATAKARR